MIIDAIDFHEDSFQSDHDWRGLSTVFAAIYAWGIENGHIRDSELTSSYFASQTEESSHSPSDWVDEKCDYQISDLYFDDDARERIKEYVASRRLYERIETNLRLARVYEVRDSWDVVATLTKLIGEDMRQSPI